MDKESHEFINPIDPDKITDSPNFLPYAHHAGSLPIKPEDQGKIKSRALKAMEYQTDVQLKQIYDQIQLLAVQAKAIQERREISEMIYRCQLKFEPLIHHIYHLYQKQDEFLLSLVGPNDWGRSQKPLVFCATVKLLSDHTWEIIEKSKEFQI